MTSVRIFMVLGLCLWCQNSRLASQRIIINSIFNHQNRVDFEASRRKALQEAIVTLPGNKRSEHHSRIRQANFDTILEYSITSVFQTERESYYIKNIGLLNRGRQFYVELISGTPQLSTGHGSANRSEFNGDYNKTFEKALERAMSDLREQPGRLELLTERYINEIKKNDEFVVRYNEKLEEIKINHLYESMGKITIHVTGKATPVQHLNTLEKPEKITRNTIKPNSLIEGSFTATAFTNSQTCFGQESHCGIERQKNLALELAIIRAVNEYSEALQSDVIHAQIIRDNELEQDKVVILSQNKELFLLEVSPHWDGETSVTVFVTVSNSHDIKELLFPCFSEFAPIITKRQDAVHYALKKIKLDFIEYQQGLQAQMEETLDQYSNLTANYRLAGEGFFDGNINIDSIKELGNNPIEGIVVTGCVEKKDNL